MIYIHVPTYILIWNHGTVLFIHVYILNIIHIVIAPATEIISCYQTSINLNFNPVFFYQSIRSIRVRSEVVLTNPKLIFGTDIGAPRGVRTHDPEIKRLVLCQWYNILINNK